MIRSMSLGQRVKKCCRPKNKRLVLAAAAAALVATGCVNQRKEVALYRNVVDGPKHEALKRDYSNGTELTLEQSLMLANGGNEQIDIEGETYLQTLIERDRAYSAFMPTISLAPTYSWQNKRSASGSAVTGGTTGSTGTGTGTGGTPTGVVGAAPNHYTAFIAPVVARANLFNGFRDVANIRATQANTEQYRNLLLDLRQTVLLETAQAYYQVLLAERSVEVLTNSVNFQNARVADMQGRLRAGIAQPLDLAQTEAQAAATRANLVTAQNNVNTARLQLALMTNADVEDARLVDHLWVPDKLMPVDEAIQTADQTRPDLRAFESAVRVARENVKVAIGEYYPSVTLDLDYYLHRDASPTSVEWSSLLALNLPIFSAGTIRADVRQAWSKLRQALYQEWQQFRQVRHDVKTAWVTVNDSARRIVELQTEVAASQEALRQATQRYTVGLATNLDVLTAQDSLLSSQLDLATEEFNHKIDYIDLLRAMGKMNLPTESSQIYQGPTSRPTTEQTKPIVPAYDIPPMIVPGLGATSRPGEISPTQPATQPAR
jgi:outer membrane protein TolC